MKKIMEREKKKKWDHNKPKMKNKRERKKIQTKMGLYSYVISQIRVLNYTTECNLKEKLP